MPISFSIQDALTDITTLFSDALNSRQTSNDSISLRGLFASAAGLTHWCRLRPDDWPTLVPSVFSVIGVFVSEATDINPVQDASPVVPGGAGTADNDEGRGLEDAQLLRIIPLRWVEADGLVYTELMGELDSDKAWYIKRPKTFQVSSATLS